MPPEKKRKKETRAQAPNARMAFDRIPKVETADEILDVSFRRASAAADKTRGTKFSKDKLARSKEIEKVRITVLKDVLYQRLEKIFEAFPDIRQMTPFYRELCKALIDVEQFKRSFAAIRWAQEKIGQFWAQYNSKITKAGQISAINPHRREYYGRLASVVKQIKGNLKFLEDARRTLKQFPVIESGTPTVAIVGFPNVGKTTLLFKLTGSKPEIAPYAFTTRNINVSYFTVQGMRAQVLDTPGTLNRFEKMNAIERQAYLAMKHVADVLVYVFDPLESFPLSDQKELFADLSQMGKPILVYVSKEDICEEGQAQKLAREYGGTSRLEEIKARIVTALKNRKITQLESSLDQDQDPTTG